MVVGEAASCMSPELRGRLQDIPWAEIRGFRNHAVHAYFSLDWAIVREIADVNMPELEVRAAEILRAEYPEVADLLDRR
jgi:uncharacterized protein with HEPN domain